MKTIIAGSRSCTDLKFLTDVIDKCPWSITSIACGMAKGADNLGKMFGEFYTIPVIEYPAQWDKLGKRAGYVRNEEMAKSSDACIVLWDGLSKGSSHMIALAKKYNLLLAVYKYNEQKLELFNCEYLGEPNVETPFS